MNQTESDFSVSPFWYRRICLVAALIGLFLLALFGVGLVASEGSVDTLFLLPWPLALIAFLVASTGFGVFFFCPREKLAKASLGVYLLASVMVATLLLLTGVVNSPFIALWILASVFAGLFGLRVLIGYFAAINVYVITALFVLDSLDARSQLLVFCLAFELPLVASGLIWFHRNHQGRAQDRAYNDLVKELSQVANKSEIVINAIVDGVIAVDSQGVIQLINPAAQEILGWGKQDALKLDYKSVLKLTGNDGRALDEQTDPIKQVIRTNHSIVNDDLTLETNSGRKMLVSVLASPVGHAGAGVIIVFRDITNQKSEERQQAEFISTASHEMRTPVATIEGYLGLALNPNTAAIDEKARVYLLKAQQSVSHLGQLFQDLLDISKVEDGRISNNPGVVNIGEFTAELVTNFETKARDKGIALVFKPQLQITTISKVSPIFYANVDTNHLREVLSNLIDNAVKYTLQGNVTVDITSQNDKVTISVHDTGLGIPPEDVSHLFQKFYRVDSTQTRDIGGTGLGLYLCRRLVETMGGRIWVESRLGEGSTFFVEFERLSHEDANRQIENSDLVQP